MLVLCSLLINACSMPRLEPTATFIFHTATIPPTPSPTETIIWFPATNTPTPMPTRTIMPTPEQRPGLGDIILQDTFRDQTIWQTVQNSSGSVAYGNNELTIAVSQPGGYLFSLRPEPILDDFYLQIIASPSLCRNMDSYGLILRATETQLYYRFVITCSGLMRLERFTNGQYSILQDWLPSGQIPLGSPATLHLGVWAHQNEFRFFIDNTYQFRFSGLTWLQGQIGVFARSEEDTALTVNFSEMVIHELQGEVIPKPTGTATP
jgi:hypothetical protein